MNKFYLLLVLSSVQSVLIFTRYENHCLEDSNDHVVIKFCSVQKSQDFRYDDETHRLCVHSQDSADKQAIMKCLVFENVQLPLRFDIVESRGKSKGIENEFELLAALAVGKGILIKVKDRNLCASIIHHNYPLHLKVCDPFDLDQIFSMSGQFAGPSSSTTNKSTRPRVARLYTT